jgi:hypothetical protein
MAELPLHQPGLGRQAARQDGDAYEHGSSMAFGTAAEGPCGVQGPPLPQVLQALNTAGTDWKVCGWRWAARKCAMPAFPAWHELIALHVCYILALASQCVWNYVCISKRF